jgi:phage N-6-adenine-methyltransferase
MQQDMSVIVSSEESCWITPPEIVQKVKNVLGEIDLDPATSLEANKIVGANRIFTVEDDALKQEWKCSTFFLNPPYGKVGNKSKAGIFADKAILECSRGNVTSGGIILLHSRLGYEWFEYLMDITVSVTLRERLQFINPTSMKKMGKAKTAQTLFALGSSRIIDRFIEEFKDSGRVYK